MKSFTIFFALVTTSAALIVPFSDDYSRSHLKTRADEQQLTNPGDEPPYKIKATSAQIEKSRVLSGVGPPEANDRHFDWDESCTDGKHREKIVTAFNAVQKLATGASERLQDLTNKLPNKPGSKVDKNNRQFILETDFAYAQMFRAFDNKIHLVKGAFDKLTENLKNFPLRDKSGNGALRFICSPDNKVLKGDGSPVCGNDKENEAVTHIVQTPEDTEIEPKYSFTKSSSITFCPKFFDDTQFPNIKDIGSHRKQDLTLDKVDCAERVLLHEYMHVAWVMDLDPPSGKDYTGYLLAAEHAQSAASFKAIAGLPDAYAWNAEFENAI
ncbi:hypothetical protein Q7P37_010418 [Cladosporium fusiforme]